MSLVARILGVFTAPRSVFESLRERPKWIDALLVFLVINAILFVPMSPIIRQQQHEQGAAQIEKNANLSEEQKTEALERQEKMMDSPVVTAVTWVSVFIGTAVMFLFWALLIWVAYGFMVGGDLSFLQSLAASSHVGFILLLSGVVKLPLVLIKRTLYVPMSPAILLADADPQSVLYAALDAFDVFVIWTFIVLAIGMAPLAKISPGKSRTSTITLFVIAVLLRIGGAAIGSMFRS